MSFLPENGTLGGGGIQADGFNATTNMIVTTGSGASVYIPGLPGTGTFVNPFPNGVLAPYGSSLGPLTEVGQSVSFTQRGFLQGRVHQFYAGVNVELPWKLVALVDYVGTLTRDLRITAPLNVLPLSIQNQIAANPSLLTQSEPNPFYGAPQLAGTTLNTPTLSYSQANLPFPQFTGVNDTGSPRGRAKYNGLELRVQRRFVEGLTLSVNYTFSKTMEALTYNSNKFTVPWVISPFDRSQNLNIVSLWELPVGKGKYFGRNWSPVLNQAFGGWQINAAFTYMTGIPTPIPAGALSVGDPRLVQPTLSQWFNTCTVLTNGNRANCASPNQPVAWQQPAPGQIVYNSTYFPSIRNAWEPQLHVSAFKWFQILERLRLEFRAEAYNITNTPIYGPPNTNFNTANFGVVTPSQINRSRNMQLALRLLF